MEGLDWIAQNAPSLGVAVFFVAAYWFERQAHRETRSEHLRDLRRCVGFAQEDVPDEQ